MTEMDKNETDQKSAYVDPLLKMRYMDGSPVEPEYAEKVSSMVADATTWESAGIDEDELEAYAAAQHAKRHPSPAAPETGPASPGIHDEKNVPDWMIEKYRSHKLSSPIEETGWLFHDDSWNNRGMVVIASTTRSVIKEFPYKPDSGTDHMRSKAKALVYASQRPETPGGFIAPVGELVSEPVYPRMRLGGSAEPALPVDLDERLAATAKAVENPNPAVTGGPSLS